MKKLLSILLAVAMLSSMLVACGGTTSKAETKEADIVYWTMWESTEAQGQAIQAAVDAYMKDTGKVVDLQFKGRGIRDVLASALDSGTRIDLFDEDIDRVNVTWGKYTRDLEAFAAESKYEETSIPGLMKACRDVAGGTLKSIPYQPFVFAFFYNQEIFDKAGVTAVPTTWEEFLAVCEKVKKAGYIPLTCDDAYITCMFGYHMSRLVGEPETERIVKEGDWDNEAVMTFAKSYEELAKKGYFSPNVEGNVWPNGQNVELAGGTAAMYLNGSWLPNEVLPVTGADFKWGCFSYPSVGGVDGVEAANFGSQVLAISASATDAAAADAFELIKYITKGEFDLKLSQDSTGIPADTTNTDWPTMLTAVRPVMNATTTRYPWAAGAEANGDMTPFIKSNTLKLCGGSITAEEFVANLKAGK